MVGLRTSLDETKLIAAGAALTVANFRDARLYEAIERRIGRLLGPGGRASLLEHLRIIATALASVDAGDGQRA